MPRDGSLILSDVRGPAESTSDVLRLAAGEHKSLNGS